MKVYKPNEFAKLIGVCVKTLQRWDNEGRLKAKRTPSNRRFYTQEQYEQYINSTKLMNTDINERNDICGES